MTGEEPEFSRTVETREVKPGARGTRMAVGIPLAIVGLALIALAVFGSRSGGVVALMIVTGAAFTTGGAYLIVGASRIPGGKDTPGAGGLPHVVETTTIKETGLPKHGDAPPKQGNMPPKGGL